MQMIGKGLAKSIEKLVKLQAKKETKNE